MMRALSMLAILSAMQAGHVTAQTADAVQQADAIADIKALIADGRLQDALGQLERRLAAHPGDVETLFLLGMIARARSDLETAIVRFRQALDSSPGATRVRLELAYTLFLAKRDEAADYHFKLAIAAGPPASVLDNIARYRDVIRNRRSWRFNLTVGIAPDTNINAASSKEQVEIFGLPFSIDPEARARSGIGIVAGGDASVRLMRETGMPLYLAAYGRMVRYDDHRFNDMYLGAEAGPEFRVSGGRLRVTATGLRRWYGGKPLVTSTGGRLTFDKVLGGRIGLEASLGARRNAYVGRSDVDGWSFDAGLAANRALDAATLGFAYARLQRSVANDPGQSSWQVALGAGALKEIGWGLRPQLSLEVGRQVNDAPLVPFGRVRRDWRVQLAGNIYKRDWQIAGLAPSLRLSWTRDISTISLYDQKRLRAELGLTKAF